MRLTGSFHTIVTHGLSGTDLSSDRGRSTSAGATLTATHLPLHSLPLVTNLVNGEPPDNAPGGVLGTALLTDHYELTMLQAALHSGAAHRRAVFEVFARHLPAGRRYGVVAGTGRVLDAIERFTFGPDELSFLRDAGIVDETTLRYLESYRFSGSVWGYAEGDVYFPGSPILVVEGTFAEAVLLETVVLSILNHDCAVASAASRMVSAAGGPAPGGRPIIEMGSRRTHEAAAVAAARAAYISGFASTSNLRARFSYGVPTSGTSAHSFTLVHDSERHAFRTQVSSLGAGTTMLVDTYDVPRAVRTAIDEAGTSLGAVRIDSGDLPAMAASVRAQLDSLGASSTRIILTGDLDEYSIAALAVAPVDGYGVGTSLVTGSGSPTAALVYKLVARSADSPRELRPVAKRSVGKPGRGGRKWAVRQRSEDGIAYTERIFATPPSPAPTDRGLLRELVRSGKVIGREPLSAARSRHASALAELPPYALQLSRGYPAIPTIFDDGSSEQD
ncbi:MAG: nicotinate phosphoribosyltransferase [Nocardiopsaceae bacterium]|nr:nicotinate phosphoribosyltransferase [Nocardiopsaceae bacterium]